MLEGYLDLVFNIWQANLIVKCVLLFVFAVLPVDSGRDGLHWRTIIVGCLDLGFVFVCCGCRSRSITLDVAFCLRYGDFFLGETH